MSRCGPRTRTTCSAVLSVAFEAYPPLGTTTPGVLGGGRWWRGLPHAIWTIGGLQPMFSGYVRDLIKNPNHHQERNLLAYPSELTPALAPSSAPIGDRPASSSMEPHAGSSQSALHMQAQAVHGADRLRLPGATTRRCVVHLPALHFFRKKTSPITRYITADPVRRMHELRGPLSGC
jgi:hypothetical protein